MILTHRGRRCCTLVELDAIYNMEVECGISKKEAKTGEEPKTNINLSESNALLLENSSCGIYYPPAEVTFFLEFFFFNEAPIIAHSY